MKDIDSPQFETNQAKVIRSLWEQSKRARQDVRDAILDERDFVYRLKHYRDDVANQRDQHRIRPRGRQLAAKHRHKLGQFSKVPLYMDARPASPDATPEMAEVALAIMDFETKDPVRGYKTLREDVFSSALASRTGAMKLTVNYWNRGGPRVEPRLIDPLDVHWTPGFTYPWDPQVPWVIEECRYRLADVLAMKAYGWKNVNKVRADSESSSSSDSSQKLGSGWSSPADGGQPLPESWEPEATTTILTCWYTRDETRKPGDMRPLPPEKQHSACSMCDYRGELGEPVCPMCGSPMGDVTEEVLGEDELAYPDGRMVVVAPSGKDGNEGVVLYDGPWPWKMRAVPILFYSCYRDPYNQTGISDTTLDRDMQAVSNALTRKIYEQIIKAPGILAMSEPGLMDPTSNEPLVLTDAPMQLAIWGGQGPPQVQFIQPPAMPSGFTAFYNIVESSLRGDMGTSDIGIRGPELKDVTASTAEIVQHTGEIPMDYHISAFQNVEGPFLGCWFDIWKDINAGKRSVPIPTARNGFEWVEVRGADLANFDFVVTAAPEWRRITQERAQAVMTFVQAMTQTPQFADLIAEAMELPPSLIRKFQQRINEQQAQQGQMAQMQAMATGGAMGGPAPARGGGGPSGPPPAPPSMNGLEAMSSGMMPVA